MKRVTHAVTRSHTQQLRLDLLHLDFCRRSHRSLHSPLWRQMMPSLVWLLQLAFPSPLLTGGTGLVIMAVCLTGDHLLFTSPSRTVSTLAAMRRAVVDSSTHGLVGGLSWAIVEGPALWIGSKPWLRCLACAVLASLVDVDHFIAAGSLKLQNALHLPSRPVFHNSSVIVLLVFVCWALRGWVKGASLVGLMVLVAWLSHHLRDANRRGLWIHPLGSTPPLSTRLYISLILSLALTARLIYCHWFLPADSKILHKQPIDV